MKSKTKSVDEVKATRLITAIKTPYLPDGKVDLAMYDALVGSRSGGHRRSHRGRHHGRGQLMSWDEHIMLIAHTAKLYGDNLASSVTQAQTLRARRFTPLQGFVGRFAPPLFLHLRAT